MVLDELGVLVEIAGYERFELLGSGGFSRVWRAYQPRFRRWVAVKVLKFDIVDERAIRGFERECHAMGQVSSHPNIVTVLDNGVTGDDRPFIVMEYFEGGTYSDKLARGPISVEELLRVGVKIAGALQTAHDGGILHRDIKPHNIFVSKFNEPALGDFGISTVDESKTSTGFAGYTVHYAPPEVLNGERATIQSDLYSLGATFFRLIGGVRPFDGSEQSMVATAIRIVTEDAPVVTREGCPERLVGLVARLMAKDPADRPRSAAEVASEFQRIQAEAGFDVSRVVVAAGQGSSELPPVVVSPGDVPTTFRSVTDPGGDAGSSGRDVPVPLVPENLGFDHLDIEAFGLDSGPETPVPPGVDVEGNGPDPDATIARGAIAGYTVADARVPPVESSEGEASADTDPDVADPDATIARSSLTGYTVAGAGTPPSGVVMPDVAWDREPIAGTPTDSPEVDGDIPSFSDLSRDSDVTGAESSDVSEAEDVEDRDPRGDASDQDGVESGDAGISAVSAASLASWIAHTSGDDTDPDLKTGHRISGSSSVSRGTSAATPVEGRDISVGHSRVSVEVVEAPRRGWVARWLYAAATLLVAASLLGLALLLTGRDTTEPEATAQVEVPATNTTAAPPTTATTTTAFRQTVAPPAPTGLAVRFAGASNLRVTWSTAWSSPSDKYRVNLGSQGVEVVSDQTTLISDVRSDEPCVSVVRIRDERFSTPARACINLAEPTLKPFNDLSPGDCFFRKDEPSSWDGDFEVIDCEARHDLEVFAVLDTSDAFDAYPGQDDIASWVDKQCYSVFPGYVGRLYSSSRYGYSYWYPTVGSWRAGHRRVTCSLYVGSDWENPDETRGSGKGSNL